MIVQCIAEPLRVVEKSVQEPAQNENRSYVKKERSGRIREVELAKDGEVVPLHRVDGVIEIWTENKFCKRCNSYHGNLPYCPILHPNGQ